MSILQTKVPMISAGAALCATLVTHDAAACGGFFCSRATPVLQAAERIIFAQDGEHITQIVEVAYEGPSEKFSWVLPVPGIPVPDVSSRQVFDRLDAVTAPLFRFQLDCNGASPDVGQGTIAEPADRGTAVSVSVLDSGSVGPFDYETISVSASEDPEQVAIEWLKENGYDVTDETGAVLGPYLANGLNLIAFRLQKGQPAGAIRPIVLEYDAPKMAIPIRPTSVSANDDMPVLVWILGEHRAVPTNYYGLELNYALINWFNPGSNYNDVVSAAADEAGGQGFVTQLVWPAPDFASSVAPSTDAIARAFDGGGMFDGEGPMESKIFSVTSAIGTWDGFLEGAAPHITLRDGFTLEELVECPNCYLHPEFYDEGAEPIDYTDPIFATDFEALEASLRDTVFRPLLEAGQLLESHEKITRLYTTMSADEMTIDPVFEFNPDLPDVSGIHTARHTFLEEDQCGGSWVAELEDGTKVYGEGTEWPLELGDSNMGAAARILRFSTSGDPEVVDDPMSDDRGENGDGSATMPGGSAGSPDGDGGSSENPKGSNSSSTPRGGCTMSQTSGGSSWSWLWVALSGAWWARRRPTRQRAP